VKVLTTREALDAAAAEWDRLPAAQADPLLSHRWMMAATSLHASDRLHVVCGHRDSRTVAIAPLVATRRNGIHRLEFIGSAVLYEPCDLLAEGDGERDRLCESLVALKLPLLLQRVAANSGTEAALRRAARGRGRLVKATSAPSHRVDIQGDWDAFLAGRSSQLRSGLRRKRKILEQAGPATFDALRPNPDELPSVLEEAFDVEADGWKGAAGTALKLNDRLREFVCDLAHRFAETGDLRVCFLRTGGRAVAMSILLEFDRRLWEIKIGYRESAARASPGRLLLWEILHDAFSRGLTSYEFLGAGDGQQPDWATSSRSLVTLVYYPNTLTGFSAACFGLAGRILRRLRR